MRERDKILKQDFRDEINRGKLGKKFVVKNDSKSTTFDVNQATDTYTANVLATLIKFLQEK